MEVRSEEDRGAARIIKGVTARTRTTTRRKQIEIEETGRMVFVEVVGIYERTSVN